MVNFYTFAGSKKLDIFKYNMNTSCPYSNNRTRTGLIISKTTMLL